MSREEYLHVYAEGYAKGAERMREEVLNAIDNANTVTSPQGLAVLAEDITEAVESIEF